MIPYTARTSGYETEFLKIITKNWPTDPNYSQTRFPKHTLILSPDEEDEKVHQDR